MTDAPPEAQPPPPPRPPRRRLAVYVGVVLLALLAWGAYGHWRTAADAADTQQATNDFTPTVRVVEAKRVDDPVQMSLPGQTEPFDSAALYARATGYIAERRVDIGSRVQKGDLLMRISAPDLDAQLVQANAQLDQYRAAEQQADAQLQQAQANAKLAGVTNKRTSTLAHEGWQTQQNADNTSANVNTSAANVASANAGIAVAKANLKAQMATVQRLQELTAFEKVTAPFDGVVTARQYDVGDLVTADSAGGAALLTLERDDVLRISVYVPQSGAVSLHDGLEADVSVPEMPGRVFKARVSRTAVALNTSSRMLLVQVDVDNPEHVLRPGLYVDVRFAIPREAPGVVLPDEALVFNAAGMQVAVVRADDTIEMRKINIYRDFGTTVEVRDGLEGGERLALSPPADLGNGSHVKTANEGQGATGRPRQAPAGPARPRQAVLLQTPETSAIP